MVNQTPKEAPPKTKLAWSMAQIIRKTQLAPRIMRVTIGGEGLRPLVNQCLPADVMKIYIPAAGKPAFVPKLLMIPTPNNPFKARAYTIRKFDEAALELDFDVVLHGDSPASVWARDVQLGDQIGFVAPRHEFFGVTSNYCIFAGDESALPAISAIVEQLAPNITAHVFLEVTDESDEIPLESNAQVHVKWLHRRETGAHDLLEKALREFQWGDQRIYAWVAGESGAVKRIRRFLQNERNVHKDDMRTAGYWR